MARDQTGRLELRENAVHGGEANVLIGVEERAVDVFSRKMTGRGAALEDLENLQPRQRHLQTGFSKVFAFHGALQRAATRWRGCFDSAIGYDARPILWPIRPWRDS